MLRKAAELIGLPVRATDGDIGSISKIFFDDDRWTVRYVVVDTGKWLPGRKVLISPISIRQGSWTGDALSVSLTREQVKSSPDIDTARPVSRQHEMSYYAYYGYPYYWGGAGLWGGGMYPWALAETQSTDQLAMADANRRLGQTEDSHLRDSSVVLGYHLEASDGEIGHVDDFILDDRTWRIRYLVVDTSNWLGGRQVLIPPDWVRSVSWEQSRVHVALTRDAVRNSPSYDASHSPEREYEQRLHTHYGRAWRDEDSGWGGREEGALGAEEGTLARLEDLTGLEVANGDADVRGWKVVGSDGVRVGTVGHLIADRRGMKVRYLEVDFDRSGSGDRLIPLEQIDIDEAKAEVRLRESAASRPGISPAREGAAFGDAYIPGHTGDDSPARREQIVNRSSDQHNEAPESSSASKAPGVEGEDRSRRR